jgi:hypothetical protein
MVIVYNARTAAPAATTIPAKLLPMWAAAPVKVALALAVAGVAENCPALVGEGTTVVIVDPPTTVTLV